MPHEFHFVCSECHSQDVTIRPGVDLERLGVTTKVLPEMFCNECGEVNTLTQIEVAFLVIEKMKELGVPVAVTVEIDTGEPGPKESPGNPKEGG